MSALGPKAGTVFLVVCFVVSFLAGALCEASSGGTAGVFAVICTVSILTGLVTALVLVGRGYWSVPAAERPAEPFWPDDVAAAGLAEPPPEEPIRRTSIRVAEVETALGAHDPEFSAAGFIDHAWRTAQRIIDAAAGGDLRSVRRHLGDSFFCSFETQRALREYNRLRRLTREPRVEAVTLVGAESDTRFDVLDVAVDLSAVELDLPFDTAPEDVDRFLRMASRKHRTECWSWLRRVGALTRAAARDVAPRCPSCGADLGPRGEVFHCDHCRTLVNSGEHDWIVAGILPAKFREPAPERRLQGWRGFVAKDPHASRQQIEDRAAFLMFRWLEARVRGDPANLTRFATPETLGHVRMRLDQGVLGLQLERLESVSVVASQVAAIDAAGGGRPDLAYVHVTWRVEQKGEARIVPPLRATLSRDESARSAEGLVAFRCSECGGPLAATDSLACEYCGARIEPGRTEWVLAGVDPATRPIMFRQRRQPAPARR